LAQRVTFNTPYELDASTLATMISSFASAR
jgi:hypothetical protein